MQVKKHQLELDMEQQTGSKSVQPHRWKPTRLPCPWDSPGKNTGVGCHFLLQCMKVKSERVPEKHLLLLALFIYFILLYLFIYAKAFDYVDHSKLWKVLQEIGMPDYLTCLLRNLYESQEAALRTGHGAMDRF